MFLVVIQLRCSVILQTNGALSGQHNAFFPLNFHSLIYLGHFVV